MVTTNTTTKAGVRGSSHRSHGVVHRHSSVKGKGKRSVKSGRSVSAGGKKGSSARVGSSSKGKLSKKYMAADKEVEVYFSNVIVSKSRQLYDNRNLLFIDWLFDNERRLIRSKFHA